MKIHQLSLFLENKSGQLRIPIRLLADAGIDILTLSLADTQQFGILRLIVEDWEKARQVLEDAGCVVNVTEVVAIEVADRPGGLDIVLAAIEQAGMNVEYMYAFTFGRGDKAIIIFRFEDADAAIEQLRSRGVNVVKGVELYDRLKK
ncbi:MAG: amino acid-binding protein [bacterium]|nr:amino acid-binding protein [bacterium]